MGDRSTRKGRKYESETHNVPIIKQEVDLEDVEETEGQVFEVIQPAIENVLSSEESEEEEDGEESVSEYEEVDDDEDKDEEGVQTSKSRNNRNKHIQASSSSLNADLVNQSNRLPSVLQGFTSVDRRGNKNRHQLTLRQKLEVLKFIETNSVNAASKIFQVDPKSVRLWRSQKDKIEEMVQKEEEAIEQGEIEGLTPRKRIGGGGRKKKQRQVVQVKERKGNRRTINLSDKVEIIRLIQDGQSQSDVARTLGISQSTIQTIWSNKADILEKSQLPKKKIKNLHWKRYSNINEALLNWYRQGKNNGIHIDSKMMLDKAIEYSEYFEKPEFKKQAPRWLKVFKRKNSLFDIDEQQPPHLHHSGMANTTPPQNLNLNPSTSHHHVTHVNHELVSDFGFPPLPGFLTGLYAPQHSVPLHSTGVPLTSPQTANPVPPSFNTHLPTVAVVGSTVTTCDAMKYIELLRNWISTTFGEKEEILSNHLNAIENAVLKRRMLELTGSNAH